MAGYFHPTFLYELLWNLAAAALVVWADRRFRLGHGRAFALYVASYCAGRLWIEMLRTDPAETFLGVRLNVFTAGLVGLSALAYLVAQRGRPREAIARGPRAQAADGPSVEAAGGEGEQAAEAPLAEPERRQPRSAPDPGTGRGVP